MELVLVGDGEVIPTNNMVNEILANTVGGAASSLRGVSSDWKELKLYVSRCTAGIHSRGQRWPTLTIT